MYPELVSLDLPVIGRLTITSFGVMMVLAFLGGRWVMAKRLDEWGDDRRLADDIMIAALVGGLVGAKLYYVVLYWQLTAADPLAMLFSRAGLVWYGGLIGGVLAVIWLVRRRGIGVPRAADLVAPALALGYGIGRMGCFLVGDDYGRPTESWIGIAFPEGAPPTTAGNLREHFGVDVPASVPDSEVLAVFPTQLFEVAASLLIFWLLWRWRDHARRAGWLFSVWLVLAGAERLLVEMFRAKDDRILGPMTLAQLISVASILVGAYLWWRLGRPPADGDEADRREAEGAGAGPGGERARAADA